MNTTVPSVPPAGATGLSGPSLAGLTGVEIRKSLSTRSGKGVAVVAALLGPIGMALSSLVDSGPVPATLLLGVLGMLTALVLLALGVLSTAGEWTHGSVQVTFLLVPQRLRVMTAKALALAAQGAAIAAVGAAMSVAVLWAIPDPVNWAGSGRAIAVVVTAAAAFALIGAGIGAALGNSAATLTGTYLVMLGVLPTLSAFRPVWASNVDPTTAIVTLAQDGMATRPMLVVAGWVVVALAAGAIVIRRRSVQ